MGRGVLACGRVNVAIAGTVRWGQPMGPTQSLEAQNSVGRASSNREEVCFVQRGQPRVAPTWVRRVTRRAVASFVEAVREAMVLARYWSERLNKSTWGSAACQAKTFCTGPSRARQVGPRNSVCVTRAL